MSALYVRNTFRGWASSVTEAPFIDTINLHTEPADQIWWTLEFFGLSHSNQTYCQDNYTETGEVDAIWCCRAGTGDQSLLAAMEPGMDKFLANKDALVTVSDWEPVDEYSNGDGDPWYRLGVKISYTYRRGG